jgi:hypothetical protein
MEIFKNKKGQELDLGNYIQKATVIPCNTCKHIIFSKDALLVKVYTFIGMMSEFYCNGCKPKYDEVFMPNCCGNGNNIKYYSTTKREVDKDGNLIKSK